MLYGHIRLKRAAMRFAGHGWPITPGAPLRAGRFDCGRPGCHTRTCHPALERWDQAPCCDPGAAAAWWSQASYSVLLPTGIVFDVLEVPATAGAAALGATPAPARFGQYGPVAATPDGRWMFLVQPGERLVPPLARWRDLVHHAVGSWIPAPPTRLAEGRVRWVIAPGEVGWRLPESRLVQHCLARVRTGSRPSPVPH
jgi:hypothetical protein